MQRAVRCVVSAAVCGVSVMSLAGLLFFFQGEALAQFFIGQPTDLTRHAGELLKIVACGCPALALLTVLTGGLRGSGDTRVPLAITFIGLGPRAAPFHGNFTAGPGPGGRRRMAGDGPRRLGPQPASPAPICARRLEAGPRLKRNDEILIPNDECENSLSFVIRNSGFVIHLPQAIHPASGRLKWNHASRQARAA